MVTGAIKNKVDKIWTDIWAGGITNPLTVIEQLTYLMFIRSLDEKELATEDFENMAGEKMEHIFPASVAGQSMRWSRFKDKDSREIFLTMQQRVFPAIKKMKYGRLPDFDANGELVEIADDPTRPDEGNTAFARYMDDAMFLIPTPQVLQKIITGLEDLYTHDIAALDMQGDLYEYTLGKLKTAGKNGQFRTPKQIRDMMVELVQPTPDDFICDPACGTAGFLVSSAQYLRAHYEDSMTPEQWQHFAGPMFTGFDTDLLGRAELAVLPCRFQLAQHILVEVALHIKVGNVVGVEILQPGDDLLQHLRRGNQEHGIVHIPCKGGVALVRAGGVVCDLHQLTVCVKVRQTAILHLFDSREHPLLHGQENFAGVLILEAAPPHGLSCFAGREDVLHLFARHVLKIFGGKLFLVQ